MKLTLEFIGEQFKKINKKHFNNELLTPRFEITHVKCYLGQYHWRYSYDENIFWESVIRISDMFDRSENDITNTIAHEMIHLYIRQNKLRDTRPHHGRLFNSIADRLNREGGFHIARTDSVEGCGLRNKSEVTEYNVLCFQTKSMKYFQMVMNKNHIKEYITLIEKDKTQYRNAYMFKSTDDKRFAHYPSCRGGFRGLLIDKDTFNRQMVMERNVQRFISLAA